MAKPRFAGVIRILFNVISGVALVTGLLLHAAQGSDAFSSDFAKVIGVVLFVVHGMSQMAMNILSLPMGAVALKLAYSGIDAGSTYATVSLSWGAIFVAGWVQWALIIPGVFELLDRRREARRAV